MVPPRLGADVDELRQRGTAVEIVEEGTRFYVILAQFALPDGKYTPSISDLMVMADYQYPMSRLDMFWTDPTVHLVSGNLPLNADQFETHLGRNWQRWSWHYDTWDPNKHNLHTHLEVIRDRLARGN